MIIRNTENMTMMCADVIQNHSLKDTGYPSDQAVVIHEGRLIDPGNMEVLFLSQEEMDRLPQWWRDCLSKDTRILNEPMEKVG